jgi:hypothetical protein
MFLPTAPHRDPAAASAGVLRTLLSDFKSYPIPLVSSPPRDLGLAAAAELPGLSAPLASGVSTPPPPGAAEGGALELRVPFDASGSTPPPSDSDWDEFTEVCL